MSVRYRTDLTRGPIPDGPGIVGCSPKAFAHSPAPPKHGRNGAPFSLVDVDGRLAWQALRPGPWRQTDPLTESGSLTLAKLLRDCGRR